MSKDNGRENIEEVKAEIEKLNGIPEPVSTGGRIIKLTPKLANKIIKHVKAGNYAKTICQMVGITEQTYINWSKRAKAQEEPFYTFFNRVERASSIAEAGLVLRIQKAAVNPKHWKAAAFLLERTRPKNFGKRVDLDLEGEPITTEVKVNLTINQAVIKYEEAAKTALRKIHSSQTDSIPAENGN